MKEKFMSIPAPLQKQIMLRFCGCVIGIAMFLIVLAYGGGWWFFLPSILLALISLSGTASMYDRCVQNDYVVIEADCVEIERAPLRRRIKTLYLRDDQFSIKLIGVRRTKNLMVGDRLKVYVTNNTAVYELDGSKVICNYLALEKVTPQKD